MATRSATECLAVAAMLFHPIQTEAGRRFEEKRRLTRRAELAAMMPGDEAFDREETVRAFFDQKRGCGHQARP